MVYIHTNVSEEYTVSIFKEKQLQEVLCFPKILVNISRHDTTLESPSTPL